MTKRSIEAANDDTKLHDVHGFGAQSFMVLGVSGYRLKPSSTVGDFKKATGSYNELKQNLVSREIEAKYVLPKFKAVWGGTSYNKRRKVQARDQPKEAHESGVAIDNSPSVSEQANVEERKDPDVNFLLAPKPIDGAPDTSQNPEMVTSNTETPEVDAMDRRADVTPAVATGDVAAKVQQSVIPDQTLTISPGDKNINAPMEVLPDDPVPVNPAIAIGPSVAAVRMVEPLTLEEKQDEDRMAEDLPQFKANGEKDLGGDGYGALTEDARIGKDAPSEDAGNNQMGKFRAVPLDIASTPSFDELEEVKQQDVRTATRHPFKQVALFRDHDMGMKISTLIARTDYDKGMLVQASREAMQAKQDLSWTRFNDATEGVRMTEMPLESSNFLQRGPMVSDYQLTGANPLQRSFPYSAFTSEAMLGRF